MIRIPEIMERAPPPSRLHFCFVAFTVLATTVYGAIIPLQYHPTSLENAVAKVDQALAIGPDGGQDRSGWLSRLTALARDADSEHGHVRADYILNSLQFGILGFFVLGAVSIDRSRLFAVICSMVVIPQGWFLAYWLEVLQVAFPPRTISANDLVVERLGFIAGNGVWIVSGPSLVVWSRAFWNSAGFTGLASRLLPIYILALLVFRWIPFDLATGLDDLVQKQALGRIQWFPNRDGLPTTILGFLESFCACIPIGAMLGMLPRWSSRPMLATILAGFALAVIMEFGQLFVMARTFRSLDILASTLGTILAANFIRNLDRKPPPRLAVSRLAVSRLAIEYRLRRHCEAVGSWGPTLWIVLIAIWAFSVIAISWQPFHFELTPLPSVELQGGVAAESGFGFQRWSWAPFVNYYWLSRYMAFDLVVKRLVFFAPLGVLTAILFAHRSRIGQPVCLVIALTIGLIIELGQCFIPERHPGMTDLCIHIVGAWLGFAFASHTIISVNRIHD